MFAGVTWITSSRSTQWLRGSRLAILVASWLLLSLIAAAERFSARRPPDPLAKYPEYLVWCLTLWAFWLVAGPFVLFLMSRFPIVASTWRRTVPIHLAAAILLGLLHAAYMATAVVFCLAPGEIAWPSSFMIGVRFLFFVELLLYSLLAAGSMAVTAERRDRARQQRAQELETQLARVRLRALETQLRPHFLFNALNTVSMLIRSDDPRRAVDMIAGLSDLLRSSLQNTSAQQVSLNDELDMVQRYLAIERARFSDRLTADFDVPPDLLSFRVPRFVLQTLIENAVQHGLGPLPGPGRIRVRACRGDARLELEVRDDGVGLPRAWDPEACPGTGLRNLRDRLIILYGPGAGLTLERAEPAGVSARVSLPLARGGAG